MRRLISVFVVACAVVRVMGCTNAQLKQIRGATSNGNAAATTDCAACEKMCTVAGDAEKNPEGVQACKDDCQKTCQ